MEQTSLIKKSPFADSYLVSVYHSLYSHALRNALREKGLFLCSDYAYEHQVYEHKLIWVTLTLLSEKAKQMAPNLEDIAPDFSKTSINTCIKSLSANTQQKYSSNYVVIKKALKELHEQPWEDYSSLDILDIQALKPRRTHFIQPGETFSAKQYVTGFRLDPEYLTKNSHSVLIFAHALDIIVRECTNTLSTTLGGSLKQKKNICNHDQALITRTHYFTEKLEPEAIGEVFGETYVELIEKGILESIIEYTKQDFRTFPPLAVIPLQVYESAYSIVGYKGWRRLMTLANLREVLDHTEIRVSDLNHEIAIPLKKVHNIKNILQ